MGSIVDLTRYGYDTKIDLEGQVVEELNIKKDCLIFIFDENHAFAYGVQQSLRNALKLIDYGIVDFVGVEGLTGLAKEKIERIWYQAGIPSLEYFLQCAKRKGLTEDGLLRMAERFVQVRGQIFILDNILFFIFEPHSSPCPINSPFFF